jgi:polysaccharide export outer membrane protein
MMDLRQTHFALSKAARPLVMGGCLAVVAAFTVCEAADQAGGSNVVASPAAVSGNGTEGTNVITMGTNGIKALDDKYKLVIGDRVSFRIVEDEGDPRPLQVTDSGDLEVPYIGRVPAVGKTCKQLAAEIKTGLDEKYYYNSTVVLAVDVMNKPRNLVYIYGNVKLPGPVEILHDEVLTLSRAIDRAGGPTDFAKLDDIQVRRKTGEGKDEVKNIHVNLTEILKGKKDEDLLLKPDDFVNVEENGWHF